MAGAGQTGGGRAGKRGAVPKAARSAKSAAGADAGPEPEAAAPEADEAEPAAKSTLSKRAFLDRVIAASGVKKKAAKQVVEATLAEIGAALDKGEALVLPPMGRMVVSRPAAGKGSAVVRFRRVTGGKGKGKDKGADDDDALAEADEAV